jgi:hypothetical protein
MVKEEHVATILETSEELLEGVSHSTAAVALPARSQMSVSEGDVEDNPKTKTKTKKKKKKKKKKKGKEVEIAEYEFYFSHLWRTIRAAPNTNDLEESATAGPSSLRSPDLSFISSIGNSAPVILDSPTTIFAGANATIHAGAGAIVHLGYGAVIASHSNPEYPSFNEFPYSDPPEYKRRTSPSPSSSHLSPFDRGTSPTPAQSSKVDSQDVKIKYQLDWKDQRGEYEVPRHTPIKDLKRIPPIQSLKEAFGPDTPVRVSPAKSASSDTRVIVEGSYNELVQRVREDLAEEFEGKFNSRLNTSVQAAVSQAFQNERNTFGLMLRRNLEDLTLLKMKSLLQDSSSLSYPVIVRRFCAKYTVEEFDEEDYEALAHSARRQEANEFAHLKVKSQEFRCYKDTLMEHLKAEGIPGELEKYQKYYDFAVGKIGYAVR